MKWSAKSSQSKILKPRKETNKIAANTNAIPFYYLLSLVRSIFILGFIFLAFAMIELITNLAETTYKMPLLYNQSDKYIYN